MHSLTHSLTHLTSHGTDGNHGIAIGACPHRREQGSAMVLTDKTWPVAVDGGAMGFAACVD